MNYMPALVGAMHKWLGENEDHDDLSLYSISWLSNGKQAGKDLLDFPKGASFSISFHDDQMLARLLKGIQDDPSIRWGMQVEEVAMIVTPDFGNYQRFYLQSPVFIKRTEDDGNQKFYFYDSPESDDLLTATMLHKMERAGLAGDVTVRFDKEYPKPYHKLSIYKGYKFKSSMCPVIVQGAPDAVKFAWEVGVGNNTGMGFGALK